MNKTHAIQEIRRFFRMYSSAHVTMPASAGNLYELYVYVNLCDAIQSAGVPLQLHSPSPTTFRFRCSPGLVRSSFSYYSFKGPTTAKDYQIWNGIEVYGNSMMRHEADIAIFEVPQNSKMPTGSFGELVLSIECKCYSSASNLKGESRKIVGAVLDWSKTSHPANVGNHSQGCIHCGTGFTPMFITNVRHGQRQDIEQFIEVYDLDPRFGFRPRASAVRAFRAAIQAKIAVL